MSFAFNSEVVFGHNRLRGRVRFIVRTPNANELAGVEIFRENEITASGHGIQTFYRNKGYTGLLVPLHQCSKEVGITGPYPPVRCLSDIDDVVYQLQTTKPSDYSAAKEALDSAFTLLDQQQIDDCSSWSQSQHRLAGLSTLTMNILTCMAVALDEPLMSIVGTRDFFFQLLIFDPSTMSPATVNKLHNKLQQLGLISVEGPSLHSLPCVAVTILTWLTALDAVMQIRSVRQTKSRSPTRGSPGAGAGAAESIVPSLALHSLSNGGGQQNIHYALPGKKASSGSPPTSNNSSLHSTHMKHTTHQHPPTTSVVRHKLGTTTTTGTRPSGYQGTHELAAWMREKDHMIQDVVRENEQSRIQRHSGGSGGTHGGTHHQHHQQHQQHIAHPNPTPLPAWNSNGAKNQPSVFVDNTPDLMGYSKNSKLSGQRSLWKKEFDPDFAPPSTNTSSASRSMSSGSSDSSGSSSSRSSSSSDSSDSSSNQRRMRAGTSHPSSPSFVHTSTPTHNSRPPIASVQRVKEHFKMSTSSHSQFGNVTSGGGLEGAAYDPYSMTVDVEQVQQPSNQHPYQDNSLYNNKQPDNAPQRHYSPTGGAGTGLVGSRHNKYATSSSPSSFSSSSHSSFAERYHSSSSSLPPRAAGGPTFTASRYRSHERTENSHNAMTNSMQKWIDDSPIAPPASTSTTDTYSQGGSSAVGIQSTLLKRQSDDHSSPSLSLHSHSHNVTPTSVDDTAISGTGGKNMDAHFRARSAPLRPHNHSASGSNHNSPSFSQQSSPSEMWLQRASQFKRSKWEDVPDLRFHDEDEKDLAFVHRTHELTVPEPAPVEDVVLLDDLDGFTSHEVVEPVIPIHSGDYDYSGGMGGVHDNRGGGAQRIPPRTPTRSVSPSTRHTPTGTNKAQTHKYNLSPTASAVTNRLSAPRRGLGQHPVHKNSGLNVPPNLTPSAPPPYHPNNDKPVRKASNGVNSPTPVISTSSPSNKYLPSFKRPPLRNKAVYDRLHGDAKRQQQKIAELEKAKSDAEDQALKKCSFKPKITKVTEGTLGTPEQEKKVWERLYDNRIQRETNKKNLHEKYSSKIKDPEEEDMTECVFKPNIRKEPKDINVSYLDRAVPVWERLNKSAELQKQRHEDKVRQVAEDREKKFGKPTLNAGTNERTRNRTPFWQRVMKPSEPRVQQIPPAYSSNSNYSFQPNISDTAGQVRSNKDVFSRLYNQSSSNNAAAHQQYGNDRQGVLGPNRAKQTTPVKRRPVDNRYSSNNRGGGAVGGSSQYYSNSPYAHTSTSHQAVKRDQYSKNLREGDISIQKRAKYPPVPKPNSQKPTSTGNHHQSSSTSYHTNVNHNRGPIQRSPSSSLPSSRSSSSSSCSSSSSLSSIPSVKAGPSHSHHTNTSSSSSGVASRPKTKANNVNMMRTTATKPTHTPNPRLSVSPPPSLKGGHHNSSAPYHGNKPVTRLSSSSTSTSQSFSPPRHPHKRSPTRKPIIPVLHFPSPPPSAKLREFRAQSSAVPSDYSSPTPRSGYSTSSSLSTDMSHSPPRPPPRSFGYPKPVSHNVNSNTFSKSHQQQEDEIEKALFGESSSNHVGAHPVSYHPPPQSEALRNKKTSAGPTASVDSVGRYSDVMDGHGKPSSSQLGAGKFGAGFETAAVVTGMPGLAGYSSVFLD